jgi:hypothetical protein
MHLRTEPYDPTANRENASRYHLYCAAPLSSTLARKSTISRFISVGASCSVQCPMPGAKPQTRANWSPQSNYRPRSVQLALAAKVSTPASFALFRLLLF